MKGKIGLSISLYLLRSVVPYVGFAWALLSVILFVQQAGRFSDIFFSANIPPSLIWQLAVALIPNVVAFTCPMAVLVGVIIGLSKMQGDSELVAIRASGIGNLQVVAPIAILGFALSIFAILVNLFGVPLAARVVKAVALQTAIYKLESPIEPGVFNTEIAGYTAYVKDGDMSTGRWRNIFIHAEDEKTGTVRLITSSDGRIDSSAERSELLLANAVSTTITPSDSGEKIVSETLGEIRFAIQTRRGDLIAKLGDRELSIEELGLTELANAARTKEGSERTEANIIWQRRMVLSLAPFLFAILGALLVLRFNRGGRGFGIFLSLISLISFYLVAFLGEQLARAGSVPVFVAGILPLGAIAVAIIWFGISSRTGTSGDLFSRLAILLPSFRRELAGVDRRSLVLDLTTGLRDFDILYDLVRYFLITLAFLSSVFLVFTAFELWRFAGSMQGGIWLLIQYLFFLLPFVYLSLVPSAAMIAVLATYVIKSRQNELVTWVAAGQSIYRLLVPCFLLMSFLGLVNWQVQEYLAPSANQIQERLRDRLRIRGKPAAIGNRLWIANDKRVYSFRLESKVVQVLNNTLTSDNDMARSLNCASTCPLIDLTVYEFVEKGERLQTLYRAKSAIWEENGIRFIEGGRRNELLNGGYAALEIGSDPLFGDDINPFIAVRRRPSQLTIAELGIQMDQTRSDVERRSFEVAIQKRYATLFLPLIIAIFTAPFALSLDRKGKVVTIGYAVGLWLLFTGVTSAIEQLGVNGMLPAGVAVWIPLVIFTALGLFLLSRVRT